MVDVQTQLANASKRNLEKAKAKNKTAIVILERLSNNMYPIMIDRLNVNSDMPLPSNEQLVLKDELANAAQQVSLVANLLNAHREIELILHPDNHEYHVRAEEVVNLLCNLYSQMIKSVALFSSLTTTRPTLATYGVFTELCKGCIKSVKHYEDGLKTLHNNLFT